MAADILEGRSVMLVIVIAD